MTEDRSLEPTMTCVKYMILALSSILLITATIILAVGTSITALYSNFDEFLEVGYMSPSQFLVAIGAILLFVSACGCLGALKESVCLINVYTLALIIIFVFELAAGLAGFAMQTSIEGRIGGNFMWSITHQYTEPRYHKTKDAIDYVQSQLGCCGVQSPLDWQGVLNDSAISYPINDNIVVIPDSCCSEIVKNSTTSFCTELFEDGCLPAVVSYVRAGAILLTVTAFVVAVIQIMAIYFASSLAKAIRRTKSLQTMRRMEIRSQLANSYEPLGKPTITPVIYLAGAATDTTA